MYRQQRSFSLNDLHLLQLNTGNSAKSSPRYVEQVCDSFNCIINIRSSFSSQLLNESGLLCELLPESLTDSGLDLCCPSSELELFEAVRHKLDPRKLASLSLSLMLVAILEALHTLTVYFSDNLKHSYL